LHVICRTRARKLGSFIHSILRNLGFLASSFSRASRAGARRESDGRVSARLIAIANALEGMDRAGAARLAGMGRHGCHPAIRQAEQHHEQIGEDRRTRVAGPGY
jgi:hypothetical protein